MKRLRMRMRMSLEEFKTKVAESAVKNAKEYCDKFDRLIFAEDKIDALQDEFGMYLTRRQFYDMVEIFESVAEKGGDA